MESDQTILETIVRALVDHPDEVQSQRGIDALGVLLTLKVHKDDMGKIIGRSGNMARALRTILRGVGARSNARVNLKVIEPDGGTHQREPEVAGTEI